MSVRPARFADIPAIVGLMHEAHQRSRYAETATFDEPESKRLLLDSINRHGHRNYGGTLVLVSVKGERVVGFVLGLLDQVYPCLKELMVTDIAFYFADDAEPRDVAMIVSELRAWGADNPKVLEVHLGVTDAVGDWRRVGKLYERLGAEQAGAMYRFDAKHGEDACSAGCSV